MVLTMVDFERDMAEQAGLAYYRAVAEQEMRLGFKTQNALCNLSLFIPDLKYGLVYIKGLGVGLQKCTVDKTLRPLIRTCWVILDWTVEKTNPNNM